MVISVRSFDSVFLLVVLLCLMLLSTVSDCRAQSCGIWSFSDEIFSILDNKKRLKNADELYPLDIANEKICIDGKNVALSFSIIPDQIFEKIGKSPQTFDSSVQILITPKKIHINNKQGSEYSKCVFLKLSGISEIIQYNLRYLSQTEKTARQHALCYLPQEYQCFSQTEFIDRNSVFYSYIIPAEKKEQTVLAIYDFLRKNNAEKYKETKGFVDENRLPINLFEDEEAFFVKGNVFLLFIKPDSDFVRISYYIRPFNIKE